MSIKLKSSYSNIESWFRGNLHTHTTESDGSCPPETVIADYESRGYDFLCISDHDILVDPSRYQRNTSMLLIPAVEVTANGPHIQQVNANNRVAPNPDRQVVVREIIADQSICILNHPNWGAQYNHFPHALMESLDGYHGIEIYNGVIQRLQGTALASDRWDRLLSNGRRLWGYGNDDSHQPGDVEIAWNVVQAEDCTVDQIDVGLRNGSFYASTGVTISSIRISGTTVHVKTKDAQRVCFVSKLGVIQLIVNGAEASYTLPEDSNQALSLSYIRAECYGSGGSVAWTQPIFIEEEV